MTCEEYILSYLDETREKLEETKKKLDAEKEHAALLLLQFNKLADIVDVIGKHIALKTYSKTRVIEFENLWENSDFADFNALYEAFNDIFEEGKEADNGEQSETCEPAESQAAGNV